MKQHEILCLEIAGGPWKQTHYAASPGEELVVGRDQAANCCVVDPRLSREHFLISFCGQQWKIRDLKSANGTFVNDQRISVCALKDEDCIQAGDTRFKVSFKSSLTAHRPANKSVDHRRL